MDRKDTREDTHDISAISDVLHKAQGPYLEEDMALIDPSQFCAISLASGNDKLQSEYKTIHMELANVVQDFERFINEKNKKWEGILTSAGLDTTNIESWIDLDSNNLSCGELRNLIKAEFPEIEDIREVGDKVEGEIRRQRDNTELEINSIIDGSGLRGQLGISLKFLRTHMKNKVNESLISIYPIIKKLIYMSYFLMTCFPNEILGRGGNLTRKRNKKPRGKSKKPYGKSKKPHGKTRKPRGKTKKPRGKSRKPHGKSRKPHGKTRKHFRKK
jgi:hypothetical protein